MNAIRRKLALAQAVALALVLGGCGGDDCSDHPTSPDCGPSPSPSPVQTVDDPVVIDAGEGGLPAFVALGRPLVTDKTGTFEVVVDWTFPTNDIDIFLARGDCAFEQFVGGGCNYAATATSPNTKPERVRLLNQPAGRYTLIIPNFGPEDESISYQVIFTGGTSAAAASRGSVDVPADKIGKLVRGIVPK